MTMHSITAPPHRLWTTAHEPALTIASGATISFDLTEASDGQFLPGTTAEAAATFDWDRVYPLLGPIMVDGAEPGDTLEIEFLDMTSLAHGWTAVLPGLSLLPDQFPDAHVHHWDLTGGRWADFLGLARVPIHPFCGVVGVCPDTVEAQSVMPPGQFGGNVDCRDLTVGTKLFLPGAGSRRAAQHRGSARRAG